MIYKQKRAHNQKGTALEPLGIYFSPRVPQQPSPVAVCSTSGGSPGSPGAICPGLLEDLIAGGKHGSGEIGFRSMVAA